jgi:peptidylprolyl isomerase
MKKIIFSLFFLLLPLSAFAREPLSQEQLDRLSESFGHFLVRNLANPNFAFNFDKVIQGIQDEREGKISPMNEAEYESLLAQVQETIFEETANKNLCQADSFLKQNASAVGIQLINEKLQYKILQAGVGEEVKGDSCPLIHYRGALIDGTVFADSYESGLPVPLPLKKAIPGFSKGIVGMLEGEKRTLYIHPELAYGVAGQLPPNSLLIFDVEIVKANQDEKS